MAAAGLTPFPWSSLPRLAAAATAAADRARAALAPRLDPGRVAAAAAALLRRPVEARVLGVSHERAGGAAGTARPVSGSPGHGTSGRVYLEFPTEPAGRLWVEAEAGLVLRVAEAILGVPAGWVDPRRAPPAEAEGAWAALLVALGRRVGQVAPRLGAAWGPGEEAAVARVSVRLDGELYAARVGVALAPLVAPVAFSAGSLDALGALPLGLDLVAAQGLITPDELAALRPGSAWAPGEGWTLAPAAGGGWQGHALLAAPAGESAIEVALQGLGPAPTLVLTRPSRPCPWEPPMTDLPADSSASSGDDPSPALAAAPVVVRVELATVTLEAREWARLGPGSVVATGVRLGEPAVLRVGGAVVARGELCDLDGELAIRILSTP